MTTLFALVSLQPVVIPVSINWDEPQQVFRGFGGSIPEYQLPQLFRHPQKDTVLRMVIDDLPITRLRLENGIGRADWESRILDQLPGLLNRSARWRSNRVQLLLTSGSPPAHLKQDGRLEGGTLAQESGQFVYDAYAMWWVDSIVRWRQRGLDPQGISIQNEPDFVGQWPTNRLLAREGLHEGQPTAGYDRALAAVQRQVKSRLPRSRRLTTPMQFYGPEVIGIGYDTVQRYLNALPENALDVIAFHLYHGGKFDDPLSFIADFRSVAAVARQRRRPIAMTEYARHDPDPDREREALNLSRIIAIALREGQVSEYYHWDLVESGGKGLVSVSETGYTVRPIYRVYQQWCRAAEGATHVVVPQLGGGLEGVAFFHGPSRPGQLVLINPTAQTVQFRLPNQAVGLIAAGETRVISVPTGTRPR